MSKTWSEANRKRQEERIHLHRPWEASTGPKSEEGKRRSSRNADKGKAPIRELRSKISQIHRQRLELLRWLEKKYHIKIIY